MHVVVEGLKAVIMASDALVSDHESIIDDPVVLYRLKVDRECDLKLPCEFFLRASDQKQYIVDTSLVTS